MSRPTPRRDRGGALLVAVVILFVVTAMISLMLAPPKAELMRGTSTIAREHSVAAADAGVKDATDFLVGSYTDVYKMLSLPTFTAQGEVTASAFFKRTDKVLFSSSTPGTCVTTLFGETAFARHGALPFPGESGTTPFGPESFRHFGDRSVQGEYAFRIAALTRGYFEVSVEAHALGVGGRMTTKLRATVFLEPLEELAPLVFVDTRGRNGPAMSLRERQAFVVFKDMPNPPPPPIMNIGASGVSWPTPGQSFAGGKVYGALMPVTGAFAARPDFVGFYGNNPSVNPGGFPDQLQADFIDKLIDSMASFVDYTLPDGIGEHTISASDAGTTVGLSGRGAEGAVLLAARWSGRALVPGSQITPPTARASGYACYFKIDANSIVDAPLFDYHGTRPGLSPAGLIVIDVGDNVEFSTDDPLFVFDKTTGFAGTVIFIQRGSLKLPLPYVKPGQPPLQGDVKTRDLILAQFFTPKPDQAKPPQGKALVDPVNGLFQYSPDRVKQAMSAFWRPHASIASYVLVQ